MHLIPFFEIFPEQGERETRTITTRGYLGLPADEYALVEAYCPDPKCDCRRVMINVVGRRQMHSRPYRRIKSRPKRRKR